MPGADCVDPIDAALMLAGRLAFLDAETTGAVTPDEETVAEGLARIRAYRFVGWELNVRLRRLTTPGGETVALTNSEFNLLAAFLAAPQRVLSRDQLLSLSRLHNDEVYDRSIDVQVGRLRKKLEAGGPGQTLIRTERGAGYVFVAAVEIVR